MAQEGYNGYTNWESFEFSAWWSNDQGMYFDFLREARKWLDVSPHEDSVELGRHMVAYARDNYAGKGHAFRDLETDEEWAAIDLREVGDEIKESLDSEGV
jgi:hypothetical protein